MSSYRRIEETTLYNHSVSGTSPIQSKVLNIQSNTAACFQIVYGATLNASFQLMGSCDGVNFFDSGAVIMPAAGTAGTSGFMGDVQAPFVLIQITPTSGTATVTITATAKGA